MCDKYIKFIEKEVKKYYISFFNYDYEKIIITCLKTYEQFENDNPNIADIIDFKKALYYFILNLSFNLDKDNFDNYIRVLKKNKFYRLKKRFIILLKLQVYNYMIQQGNFNFVKNKSTKKKLQYYFDASDSFKTKLKKIFLNYLSLNYIELVITTKCTLRCESCANLMYKYSKSYNVDLETIKKSINKLLECCDEIKVFRILGGEPFCNNDLKYILNELKSPKIKEIIIVTNGTLIPRDSELIKIIRENKIIIEISDYNSLSSKKQELINLCNENNITCYCGNFVRLWQDYGDLKNYKNNIKKQFFYCNINCKSILNGNLYYCPRQAHGTDLKIIEKNNTEYIELTKNSKKENKKQLKKYIFRNNPISACNYCKYATENSKIIQVAKQIRRGEI